MPHGNPIGTSLRLVFAILAPVLVHGGVAGAADLAICVDKASPTAVVDARLAREIAAAAGAVARIHEYDGRPRGDDDSLSPHDFKQLLGTRCRLVIGYPYEPSAGALPRYLKASAPYAYTGFALITRQDSAHDSLAAMPPGSHVAVAYDTLPNHYFRHHPNLVRDIVEDDAEALAAVERGAAVAAMAWRPAVVRLLDGRHAPHAFRLDPIDEPGSQWPLVALAAADDTDAVQRFDAAVRMLRDNGKLAATLGGYADATAVDAARPQTSVTQRALRTKSARTCAKGTSGKSPPALFTAAQAVEGRKVYEEKCAFCHAPDMTGRAAPALKGKFFAAPSHKYKIRDIFTIVAQNMPATSPGSLSQDEYAHIMAYILQQNGYPAGDTDLTFEAAMQSKASLHYYGE